MRPISGAGCTFVMTLVAAACSGGPPSTSGGACQTLPSANWTAITYDFVVPPELGTCSFKLSRADTMYVTGLVEFMFNTARNNGQGTVSGNFFRLWTKNTANSDGSPIAPFVQDSGYFVLHSSPVVNGETHIKFQLPLEFFVGWRPETTKFERESLYVHFGSLVSRPNPTGSPFGDYDGDLIHVSQVIRGETTPGNIAVVSAPGAGVATSMLLVPSSDTLGYRYQWYVDGAPKSGEEARSFSHTFPLAGNYTVRVDQRLLDTTFVVTKSVTVPLNVFKYGPSEVAPYTGHEFTAAAAAGTGPYTFVWHVNGTPVETGSTLNWYFNQPETSVEVAVYATDANQATGSVSGWVTVTSGCDPADPGCEDQLRESAPVTERISRPRGPQSLWRRLFRRP